MSTQSFTESFSKVFVILLFCISLSVFSLLFPLPLVQFGNILIFVDLLSLLWFYTCSEEQLRFAVQPVILDIDTLTTFTVARKAIYNNLLCFNLFIYEFTASAFISTNIHLRVEFHSQDAVAVSEH